MNSLRKILLLDDDRIHNDLNLMVMNLIGLTNIDICTSGREALQYFENCKKNEVFPSLMFVDLDMPGMNGFKFIEEYEKHFRIFCPESWIVMLTNSILNNDRDKAMKYKSVLEFLSKPLTTKRLSGIIERLEGNVHHSS